MNAVGIIAEYDPFHNGHLYQTKKIRELRGGEMPIIAVLSGDFVQRGEAAVYGKFARAEAAVCCGVSLVIELPLPWSLSSAEGFARGGVGLLAATGVVDAVAFGSESADLAALEQCAAALDREELRPLLRGFLKEGISFAAARQRAVTALKGEETARVLGTPNDLLGVEYLRAAAAMGFAPAFLPIRRRGAAHDGPGSASSLRGMLAAGEDISPFIPPEAAAVFHREEAAGRGPVLPKDLRLPLLSRLRERDISDFAALPDAGEGLENRLFQAAREETSVEDIAMAAKSKRYALARLRRMTLCAALGVTQGMADGTPPYIRVLAMDEKGASLLHEMRQTARVPVLVKPASVRTLGEDARSFFALGSRAHDLYVLGYSSRDAQRGTEDYRTSPFCLNI